MKERVIDLIKKVKTAYKGRPDNEILKEMPVKIKYIASKLRNLASSIDYENQYFQATYLIQNYFDKKVAERIIELSEVKFKERNKKLDVIKGGKILEKISPTTLSNVFNGKTPVPDTSTLDLLAITIKFAGWNGFQENVKINDLFKYNNFEIPDRDKREKQNPSPEYRKKLKLLGLDFIDESFFNTLDLKNGNPQNLYRFSNPQWTDILLEYDIRRDIQNSFLQSINTLKSFQCKFYPIVGASGQGKSTFLKRIAYEQSKKEVSVLFWELHSSKSEEHLEKVINLIKNYLLDIEDAIFLFIDNCFKINLETLLAQLEYSNIRIIGTSKLFEYNQSIDIFACIEPKINISQLSINELSLIKKKIQLLNLSKQSKNTLETNIREFSSIISSVLPDNKFGLRFKKIINRIEDDKLLIDVFLTVCLFYRYGISIQVDILYEYLINKYKDEIFYVEDLLLEISNRVEGEIIFTEEETLRLRHEKWAEEGLSYFFRNENILIKYYKGFLNKLDYLKSINREFFLELFDRMLIYRDKKIADSIFAHQEIRNIFDSFEINIGNLFDRYFILKKRLVLLSDNQLINSLKKCIQKGVISNDFVCKIRLDYLSILEDKYVDSKQEVLEVFLKLSLPSRIKNSRDLWNYCISNKRVDVLKDINVYKYKLHNNNSLYAAKLIYIYHLLKDEEAVKFLVDNKFEKEANKFKEVKLKYFLARKEYQNAVKYANSFIKEDFKSRKILDSCYELMFKSSFEDSKDIIDELKEKNDNKWLYMAVERYVYHKRKLELRQFLDFYSEELNFRQTLIKRLWYIVAIATYNPVHAYHKYNGIKKWEKAETIISSYDKFLPKIYFYLGKLGIRKLSTIGQSLYFLKKSKEMGYLFREFDYPVTWVLSHYPRRLKELFEQSKDKGFYITRLVNSILQYGELIGKEESDMLINFFLDHIKSNQSQKWDNYNYLETYIIILRYKNGVEQIKELILKVNSLFPKEPKAYSLLADFYEYSENDLLKAEEYYLKAKEVNNNKYAIHIYNLALFYIRNKFFSKMREAKNLLIKGNEIGRNIPLLEKNFKIIERIEKEFKLYQ